MKIDDDYIAQAERINQELIKQGVVLDSQKKERMLFDIMGHTSVRYCQEQKLAKERQKLLVAKYQFSKQLYHLKIKGKKLESLRLIDTEIMDEVKQKLGLIELTEKEKIATHIMKDKMDELQGYDAHHHGENGVVIKGHADGEGEHLH